MSTSIADIDSFLSGQPSPPKPTADNYDEIIDRHAKHFGVDADLVRAVIQQESNGRRKAVSPKGASGLMQLMPATASRFGVRNINDPEENIRGGTEYLSFLSKRYGGDVDKMLAGYNSGEGNVDKYGGIPPFPETQQYVPAVRAHYRKLTGREPGADPNRSNIDDIDSFLESQPESQQPQSAQTAQPQTTGVLPEISEMEALGRQSSGAPDPAVTGVADGAPAKIRSITDKYLRIARGQTSEQSSRQQPTRRQRRRALDVQEESAGQYSFTDPNSGLRRYVNSFTELGEALAPFGATLRTPTKQEAEEPLYAAQQAQAQAQLIEKQIARLQVKRSLEGATGVDPEEIRRSVPGWVDRSLLGLPPDMREDFASRGLARAEARDAIRPHIEQQVRDEHALRKTQEHQASPGGIISDERIWSPDYSTEQDIKREVDNRVRVVSEQIQWEQANETEIAKQTDFYKQQIQGRGGVDKWIAELTAKGGSGLAGLTGGLVKAGGRATSLVTDNAQPTDEAASRLRISAVAAQRAAVAEAAGRSDKSKLAQDVAAGFISAAPALMASSVGVPAWLAFGSSEALQATGMGADLGEATQAGGHGAATGLVFDIPVGEGLRPIARTAAKAGTVGVGTAGVELALGASPEQAFKSGATNALLATAFSVLHGHKALADDAFDYVIQNPNTPDPIRDVVAKAAKYGTAVVREEGGTGRNLSIYRDPKTGGLGAVEISDDLADAYDPASQSTRFRFTRKDKRIRPTAEVTKEQYDELLRNLNMFRGEPSGPGDAEAEPKQLTGSGEAPETAVQQKYEFKGQQVEALTLRPEDRELLKIQGDNPDDFVRIEHPDHPNGHLIHKQLLKPITEQSAANDAEPGQRQIFPTNPKPANPPTPDRPRVPETAGTIEAQMDALVNGRGSRMAVFLPPGTELPIIPGGFKSIENVQGTLIYPSSLTRRQLRHMIRSGMGDSMLGHVNPESPTATLAVVARAGVKRGGVKVGDELMSSYVEPGNEAKMQAEMSAQFAPYQPTFEIGGAGTEKGVLDDRLDANTDESSDRGVRSQVGTDASPGRGFVHARPRQEVSENAAGVSGARTDEPTESRLPSLSQSGTKRKGTEDETIVTAAIRSDDGTITTGKNHPQILLSQGKAVAKDRSGPEYGFVTSTGRFVSRTEAAEIAGVPNTIAAGQLYTEDLTAVRKATEARTFAESKAGDIIGNDTVGRSEVFARRLARKGKAQRLAEEMGGEVILDPQGKGKPMRWAVVKRVPAAPAPETSLATDTAANVLSAKKLTPQTGASGASGPSVREGETEYVKGQKYYQPIPEITHIDPSLLEISQYDKNTDFSSWDVSPETARQMKYDEPVEASLFSDGTLQIIDGHHRVSAARQTGRKSISVKIRAINAKGERIQQLIADSRRLASRWAVIKPVAAEPAPETSLATDTAAEVLPAKKPTRRQVRLERQQQEPTAEVRSGPNTVESPEEMAQRRRAEDVASGRRSGKPFQEIIKASPEDAALLPDRDFDDWARTRTKTEGYRGEQDLENADELHRAYVAKGELDRAKAVRDQVYDGYMATPEDATPEDVARINEYNTRQRKAVEAMERRESSKSSPKGGSGALERERVEAKPYDHIADAEQITGFTTAQGSTYTVTGQSTQRTKSLHKMHEASDVGLKEASDRTVYVSPEDATKIGAHSTLNKEAKPTVKLTEHGIILSNKYGREADGTTYTKTKTEVVPYSSSPEVGKAPVEFLPRGKVHPGNEITELQTAQPEATDAPRRLPPETTAPETELKGSAVDQAATVDDAAHEAATSPNNDLPEPSHEQREAGNYQMGHSRLAGLDLTLEIPEGGERKGIDKTGRAWSQELTAHYGYIKRSEGADGEQVDVFVKPGTPVDYEGPIFVVNQSAAEGTFDEHKVMIGWPDEAAARAGYLSNYQPGWDRILSIGRFDFPTQFRDWLQTGDLSKPFTSKEEPDAVQVGETASPDVAGPSRDSAAVGGRKPAERSPTPDVQQQGDQAEKAEASGGRKQGDAQTDAARASLGEQLDDWRRRLSAVKAARDVAGLQAVVDDMTAYQTANGLTPRLSRALEDYRALLATVKGAPSPESAAPPDDRAAFDAEFEALLGGEVSESHLAAGFDEEFAAMAEAETQPRTRKQKRLAAKVTNGPTRRQQRIGVQPQTITNPDAAPPAKTFYHATSGDFDEFRVGTHFGTAEAANARSKYSRAYGPRNVRPVKLKIDNPLRVKDDGTENPLSSFIWSAEKQNAISKKEGDSLYRDKPDDKYQNDYPDEKRFYDLLRSKGYDGLVYENATEDYGEDSYVIFDSSQARPALSSESQPSPQGEVVKEHALSLLQAAEPANLFPSSTKPDRRTSTERRAQERRVSTNVAPREESVRLYKETLPPWAGPKLREGYLTGDLPQFQQKPPAILPSSPSVERAHRFYRERVGPELYDRYQVALRDILTLPQTLKVPSSAFGKTEEWLNTMDSRGNVTAQGKKWQDQVLAEHGFSRQAFDSVAQKIRGLTSDFMKSEEGVQRPSAMPERRIADQRVYSRRIVNQGRPQPGETKQARAKEPFAELDDRTPKFTVAGNRITINRATALILSKAVGQRPGTVGGLHLNKDFEVEELAAQLRSGLGPEAIRLATLIESRFKKFGSVNVALPERMQHEVAHEVLDPLISDTAQLTSHKYFPTIKASLQELGYTSNYVFEGAAFIAEGRSAQLGLTSEQAVEWLELLMQGIVEAHPDLTVEQFEELSNEVQQAARKAIYSEANQAKHRSSDERVQSLQSRRRQRAERLPDRRGGTRKQRRRLSRLAGAGQGDRAGASLAREQNQRAARVTQTETPVFKSWFGRSKVVDRQGKPLVVYHRSPATFDEFDPDKIAHFGFHFGTQAQARAMPAEKVGDGPTYAVYLSIQNPLRLPDFNTWPVDTLVSRLKRERILTRGEADLVRESRNPYKELREFLQAQGYDGVVYRNDVEGRTSVDSYIAFEPTQIKSATDNRGTFDRNSSNMRFALDDPWERVSAMASNLERLITEELKSSGEEQLSTDRAKDELDQERADIMAFDALTLDERGKELINLVESGNARASDIAELAREATRFGLSDDSLAAYLDSLSTTLEEELRQKATGETAARDQGYSLDQTGTVLASDGKPLFPSPKSAKQKPRSLSQTLADAHLPSGDDATYQPQSFDEGEDLGRQMLMEKGVDGTIEYVLNGSPGIGWGPAGFAALDAMQSEERTLRKTDPTKADVLQAKIDEFAGEFSARATELGRAIVSINIIERFAPDRAEYELNRAKLKGRKKAASQAERDRFHQWAMDLQRENDALKANDRVLAEKQKSKPRNKAKKNDYQSKLDEQAKTILQMLKPKMGNLNFVNVAKTISFPDQAGKTSFFTGAGEIRLLQGDAEAIAQYTAAQLAVFDTVAELDEHLLSEFGEQVGAYLPAIHQRAYKIRTAARLAELEAGDTPKTRRRTILSEIQKEMRQADQEAEAWKRYVSQGKTKAEREAEMRVAQVEREWKKLEASSAKAEEKATKRAALEAQRAVVRDAQVAAKARAQAERATRMAEDKRMNREQAVHARQLAKAAREREVEEVRQLKREARARLDAVRKELADARAAELKGYRASVKARKEAARQAGLWDAPLRGEAITARARLQTATNPKDPEVMRDLVSVAIERFLPDERTVEQTARIAEEERISREQIAQARKSGMGVREIRQLKRAARARLNALRKELPNERTAAVRTKAVEPARFYVDLKREFPRLATKRNQRKVYKQAWERIEEVKAVGREAARLRSAHQESQQLWEQGIDLDEQAILIRRADHKARQLEIRTKMAAELARVSQSVTKKIISAVFVKSNGFMRAMMSSIDAPLGRQGLYPILTHPIRALRVALPATARGYAALRRSDMEALEADTHEHPRWTMAKDLGLELTEVGGGDKDPLIHAEEQFGSPLAMKFPHVRLSEQAYTSAMNDIRLDFFDIFATALERDGYTVEDNREEFEDAVGLVNKGTGRGDLPEWAKQATKFSNAVFFAARFGVSHFQLMNDLFNPVKYLPARFNPVHDIPGFKSYNPTLRKQQLWQVIRLGFMFAALYGLAKLAGFDVSEFPIIRRGNARYDLSGGKVSAIKQVLKVAEAVDAAEQGRPSKDLFMEAAHFGRGKLSPLASMGVDTYYKKNVIGQPANYKIQSPGKMMQENIVLQRVMPIIFGDFVDAYADDGWMGVLKTSPAITGLNVNTYPDSASTLIQRAKKNHPAAAKEMERLRGEGFSGEIHLPKQVKGESDASYRTRAAAEAEAALKQLEQTVQQPWYKVLKTKEQKQGVLKGMITSARQAARVKLKFVPPPREQTPDVEE